MEYIKSRAEKFARTYIRGQVRDHQTVIRETKSELYDIITPIDKITFLRVILETNEEEYQRHLLKCTNKNNCPTNYDHESIQYFLGNELSELGIRIDEDQFTVEERDIAESKLDKILADLEILKAGQKLTYDDIMDELNELRDFYILGKKKWFQLFLGKTTEMVIGGVISETVSKELISIMGEAYQNLLN